jgi:hypothetical protein
MGRLDVNLFDAHANTKSSAESDETETPDRIIEFTSSSVITALPPTSCEGASFTCVFLRRGGRGVAAPRPRRSGRGARR